jgi:hypothetical protein
MAASGERPARPVRRTCSDEIDLAVKLADGSREVIVAPFGFQLRSCSRARSKGAGEIWIGPENGTSMSRIR